LGPLLAAIDPAIDAFFSRLLAGVYKNMARGIVPLVYRCRPLDGPPHPTSESMAVAWLATEQVAEAMAPAYAFRVANRPSRRTRQPRPPRAKVLSPT
jgi:8-oxo-dGTP diphosphatase